VHGKLGEFLVITNQHVDTEELLAEEEVLFQPLQAIGYQIRHGNDLKFMST
jgi:hypothetical protein